MLSRIWRLNSLITLTSLPCCRWSWECSHGGSPAGFIEHWHHAHFSPKGIPHVTTHLGDFHRGISDSRYLRNRMAPRLWLAKDAWTAKPFWHAFLLFCRSLLCLVFFFDGMSALYVCSLSGNSLLCCTIKLSPSCVPFSKELLVGAILSVFANGAFLLAFERD